MPWDVKKEGDKFCVFDKNGKKMKCYSEKSKAEDYKKALYANAKESLESIETVMLEKNGPVIVGVAATNIPHLPLPPMDVVNVDGKEMLRVPILRSGIFRYPRSGDGKLVFTDGTLDRMLENHLNGKSHYGVSLNIKHNPDFKGALAWFDKDRGGKIVKEQDPTYGSLLVGYGNPTSAKAVEMIKNKEYVFASAEFLPNHKDVMMERLSWDDLDEIELEDLLPDTIDILEERKMEEVTIKLEELDALKDKASEAEKLEEKIVALETQIVELKDQIKEQDTDEGPEIPEEIKLEMDAQREEIKRLKRGALETQVNLVIAKAEQYRDDNGYGHSPVLLEIARAAMMGKEIEQGEDEAIKLESGGMTDIADYFRKVIVHMLETIPGQVLLESRTQGDDGRSFGNDGAEFTAEEIKAWWGETVEQGE